MMVRDVENKIPLKYKKYTSMNEENAEFHSKDDDEKIQIIIDEMLEDYMNTEPRPSENEREVYLDVLNKEGKNLMRSVGLSKEEFEYGGGRIKTLKRKKSNLKNKKTRRNKCKNK
jgi:hypothetical protein